MRGLVQRIEREPALDQLERTGEVAGRLAGGGQVAQRGGQLALEGLPLGVCPLLEVRRVAHHEALEEAAAEQPDCRLQVARGAKRVKPVDVHLEPVALGQPDVVAVRLHPLGSHDRPERGQRAPQRSPGPREVGVGPQQVREGVARPRTLGKGEVGQQRGRLAGVEGDRFAVPEHLRRAEQPDVQHHEPSLRPASRNVFRTRRGEGRPSREAGREEGAHACALVGRRSPGACSRSSRC